jgi:hypothetical protein
MLKAAYKAPGVFKRVGYRERAMSAQYRYVMPAGDLVGQHTGCFIAGNRGLWR